MDVSTGLLHKSTECAGNATFRELQEFSVSFHPFTIGKEIRVEGMDTGWRRLPASLLEIPSGGEWDLWLDGQSRALTVRSGEAALIPAGLRHRLRCRCERGMDTRFLLFTFRWMSHLDLLPIAQIPILLPEYAGRRLKVPLDEMAEIWSGKSHSVSSVMRLNKLAFELLDILMGYGLKKELYPENYDMERVKKALDIISSDPAAEHSCCVLARKCGLSPSRFNVVFKEAIGSAPKVYMRDMRLRRASAILLSSDMPVYLVAEACGFNSASYFSRFFARHIGMPPADFRAVMTVREPSIPD